MSHRRSLVRLGTVLLLVSLLAAVPTTSSVALGPTAPPSRTGLVLAQARTAASPPPTDNESYTSSVDGFPLSYLEWLPAGYAASQSYPLAVFLHGVGTSTTWVRGGIGGAVDMTTSLVDNASKDGFILISINTRSAEGFYVNSPCGGPQEQDVLDAIAHESSLRHLSHIYLIGFSMGSLGVLSLAGHHPGMFTAVATAGTISDIFETVDYNEATGSAPTGLFYDECGAYPSPQNTSVDRVWSFLSVLRFHPENFSGIPLFVSGGGQDTRAPNNFYRWPYANVNNTFVNTTCQVAADLGEPANCTVTIPTLAKADPSAYSWVDLYEPDAPHSTGQLPGASVFGFFLGQVSSGYYVSTFPGDQLIPYTPGTPIHLPGTTAPGDTLLLYAAVGAVAIVAVVAVAVVLARRRRR